MCNCCLNNFPFSLPLAHNYFLHFTLHVGSGFFTPSLSWQRHCSQLVTTLEDGIAVQSSVYGEEVGHLGNTVNKNISLNAFSPPHSHGSLTPREEQLQPCFTFLHNGLHHPITTERHTKSSSFKLDFLAILSLQ